MKRRSKIQLSRLRGDGNAVLHNTVHIAPLSPFLLRLPYPDMHSTYDFSVAAWFTQPERSLTNRYPWLPLKCDV